MDTAKIAGALFGAAAADALGATFEGLMPDSSRVPVMQGGGQFSLKPGEITDDTLMMLDLLETYADEGYFSREGFLQRMIATIRNRPKTFGNTTRTLARFVEMGCYPKESANAVHSIFGSGTNGSVMRTLPVGLVATSPADAAREARRVSSFTHADTKAADACAAVSEAVCSILQGASKEDVLSAVPSEYLEGELYPSVDAFEATRCAFCIFRDGENYVDIVTKACQLGGDTDTIGAIAGGLAGALYGISSIPKDWLDTEVRGRIERVIEKIWGFTSPA